MEALEKSTIDFQVLEQLNAKLLITFEDQGRFATFAEWATFAHFTLNLDPILSRAMAKNLVLLIETLSSAISETSSTDFLIALHALAQFIGLGINEDTPEAEAKMMEYWDTFLSKVEYPSGANQMGWDPDAAVQRLATSVAITKIQQTVFPSILDDYPYEAFPAATAGSDTTPEAVTD